jgi:hypothetical protein
VRIETKRWFVVCTQNEIEDEEEKEGEALK